jgi:hypothetical protein
MFRTGVVAVALSSVLALGASEPLSVRDIDGRTWSPFVVAPSSVHLLFFISADCPISSRYAPEIDRIAAGYVARHVQTLLIYPTPRTDPAAVRANLKEFHVGSSAPAIIDVGFKLTDAMGATVTPEAVVLTSAGRVYRGRIDDLYVTAGQSRRAAQRHDLRDALDAVLAGRPIAQAETPAIGCFIERKSL